MGRLEEIKKKFQILNDWTITIGSDRALDGTLYTGQGTINLDKHIAVIYPWHTDESEPPYYILHEILHIACRAALIDREHEELFVQDLCAQFKEKDQKIERLKKAVITKVDRIYKLSFEQALYDVIVGDKETGRLRKSLEDIKVLVARRWVTNMPGRRILEIIDKELKEK